jgi:hypothetical protein
MTVDINEFILKERERVTKEFDSMMKDYNRPTPYDTVGDYVESWIKNEYGCYEEFVVGIKMKYDHEREYEHINVIFSFDSEHAVFCWDYDWWEGQQEVYVEGIIPISEIKNYAYGTNAGGKNFYVKGGE